MLQRALQTKSQESDLHALQGHRWSSHFRDAMRHIADVHAADISWSCWPMWSPWKQLRLGRLWSWIIFLNQAMLSCFALPICVWNDGQAPPQMPFRSCNDHVGAETSRLATTQQMSTQKSDEFTGHTLIIFISGETNKKDTEQCNHKQLQPCLRHLLLRSQPSKVDDWAKSVEAGQIGKQTATSDDACGWIRKMLSLHLAVYTSESSNTENVGFYTKIKKEKRKPEQTEKNKPENKKIKKTITLLRVIPTMTFIHFVTGKSSGILSDISSGILSGISSGILSGISSGILSTQIFWHSIWQTFWHLIWHIFWHSIWNFIWHSIWHTFWHIFWHSIWHIVWHSIWHIFWHSIWHIF